MEIWPYAPLQKPEKFNKVMLAFLGKLLFWRSSLGHASAVAPRPRDGPLTEPTADAQPWRRERVLMPLSRHLTSAQRERVAAIRSSIRCPSFDNAESGLTTYERHVEGHYRLGEALEGECTNLFGCDASL